VALMADQPKADAEKVKARLFADLLKLKWPMAPDPDPVEEKPAPAPRKRKRTPRAS
jgi:hypothetical protein